MNRLLPSLTACALVATVVVAGPRISPLREGNISHSCQFSANDATGLVVLQLNDREAMIHLDGTLTRLSVKEIDCISRCVGPGKEGVRVFQLIAPGVLATLTKSVTCAKDAEVCGGLPEGNAELRVSTESGETAIRVWGEYCDM